MNRLRTVVTMLALTGASLVAAPALAGTDDEERFVDLINSERAAVGVSELEVVPELVEGARGHAADMAAAGHLFHNQNLADVAEGWTLLGENVGMGGDVESLHAAFMGSPDHRANLLNPAYDAVGVGVVWSDEVPHVVQVFMDSIVAPEISPPFSDDEGSVHESDIIELYERGVTQGCAADLYCPDRAVTRGEMATFLVRAFDLPASVIDGFSDDAGSIHGSDINALAASGITKGCGPTEFCPERAVTRAEMATFLVRALELPSGSPAGFDDTAASAHAGDIDALAHAGITQGCSDTSFCPTALVTRAQMASFLVRAMDR